MLESCKIATDEGPCDLPRSIGVRTVLTSYDNSIAYGRSGKVFSAAEEQHVEQLRLRIERVLVAAQERDADQSLQAAVEAGLDWDSLGASDQRLVDLLLNSIYEHEYAGSTREMRRSELVTVPSFSPQVVAGSSTSA